MKYEIFVGLDSENKEKPIIAKQNEFIDARVVLKYICKEFNVTIDEIKAKNRKGNLVIAREAYVWLYRQLLIKKGYATGMHHLVNVTCKNSKHYHNTKQVMEFIGRPHCLATYYHKAFSNLFFTNKELEKKAYEWLNELDKLM